MKIVTTEKLDPVVCIFALKNGSNNESIIKIVADKSPNRPFVAALLVLFHPITSFLSI